MRYSKRLTSFTSNAIFVFVCLAGTIDLYTNYLPNPWIQFVITPFLLLYLVAGTAGWTWAQHAKHYYQAFYYGLMIVLGSGIIIIATWVTRDGIAAAIIVLPLAMHGAMLPTKMRFLFLTGIMSGVVAGGLIGLTWLDAVISILAVLSGVLAFDFAGRVIVSEERAHEQLARYASEVEELSIIRERNRLAREIHDNLGHYLTAINMQAQAAHAVLKVNPQQTQDALTHIQSLAHEGLQELRRSIAAVRASPMENRSLHEAIEMLVTESQTRGLAVDFQIEGKPVPSSAEVEMTLYRVVQEALTNIIKHSQAQCVSIMLRYQATPAFIGLQVSDNGIGAEKTDEGFGLLGLRERVHLLDGTFQTWTMPGKGFSIEVEIKQ